MHITSTAPNHHILDFLNAEAARQTACGVSGMIMLIRITAPTCQTRFLRRLHQSLQAGAPQALQLRFPADLRIHGQE